MTKELSGTVVFNPYGNWADVDKGWYLRTEFGLFDINEFLAAYEGKVVKIAPTETVISE